MLNAISLYPTTLFKLPLAPHTPYLSALDFWHSLVWHFEFDELNFFPSLNWIFTACVACNCKNHVHQTRYFKLENVKNQAQIDRPSIYLHLISDILEFEISSLNWIFAGYTGSKNPVQTSNKSSLQTGNFKLENVKNQVQIDRGTGMI